MSESTRDHVFAATHFFLGPTNFLVLRLPARWEVRIGRNPSEVDYSTQLGDVRWASEGRAAGLLLDPVERRAVELEIRTARGPLRPDRMEEKESGTCRVGGHAANFTLGEVPVGLTRRRRIRALDISFRCEATQRNVRLRFLSRCSMGELHALMPSLEGARCH